LRTSSDNGLTLNTKPTDMDSISIEKSRTDQF